MFRACFDAREPRSPRCPRGCTRVMTGLFNDYPTPAVRPEHEHRHQTVTKKDMRSVVTR